MIFLKKEKKIFFCWRVEPVSNTLRNTSISVDEMCLWDFQNLSISSTSTIILFWIKQFYWKASSILFAFISFKNLCKNIKMQLCSIAKLCSLSGLALIKCNYIFICFTVSTLLLFLLWIQYWKVIRLSLIYFNLHLTATQYYENSLFVQSIIYF